MSEQLEKVKDWYSHVNRSYKIAFAIIIVLSVGATVYWAYVRDEWGTQMFTNAFNRYKCVFNELTDAVTKCAAEVLPGTDVPVPAPVTAESTSVPATAPA